MKCIRQCPPACRHIKSRKNANWSRSCFQFSSTAYSLTLNNHDLLSNTFRRNDINITVPIDVHRQGRIRYPFLEKHRLLPICRHQGVTQDANQRGCAIVDIPRIQSHYICGAFISGRKVWTPVSIKICRKDSQPRAAVKAEVRNQSCPFTSTCLQPGVL